MLKREKPFRLYSSETHDIRFFKKPNHRNTVIKVVINKKDRDDWIIEPLYNAPFNRLVKDIAELIHQLIKHDVLNNISINTHSEMTFDNDPSWKNHEYIHYATSEKSQVQVGLAHISLDNAIRNYRYLCWISYRGIAQIDQLSAYELEPLIRYFCERNKTTLDSAYKELFVVNEEWKELQHPNYYVNLCDRIMFNFNKTNDKYYIIFKDGHSYEQRVHKAGRKFSTISSNVGIPVNNLQELIPRALITTRGVELSNGYRLYIGEEYGFVVSNDFDKDIIQIAVDMTEVDKLISSNFKYSELLKSLYHELSSIWGVIYAQHYIYTWDNFPIYGYCKHIYDLKTTNMPRLEEPLLIPSIHRNYTFEITNSENTSITYEVRLKKEVV